MKNLYFYMSIISIVLINGFSSSTLNAQTIEPKATNIEIKKSGEMQYSGELYATVDEKSKKISDSAIKAWIINDGKNIVYSATDGAGGYENEGESLRIYSVKYGDTRKILSEYYNVTAVGEKKLSNGKTALLVRLTDGGLGGSYFAVVDPTRGEVFFTAWAELLEISGDTITLGFYKESDWETMNTEREFAEVLIPKRTKIKPYKTEKHDLKKLLTNEFIYNEKENRENPAENDGLKKVKIYLWRANDNVPNQNFILSPVPRYVNPKVPLSPTLAALFNGANEDESEQGFSSSTFGLKFEGVVLKSGVATIKISQSPNERNYGTLGPFIFLEAIKKTAMQFPTVKKVKICAIGETFIDSELEKPFSRCSK
ncbi:MAG: GerMN domain-containing protein [Pyrinomonadaceae bacterium]